MNTYLELVPEEAREQVKEITRSSGLEYNDESIEKMAEAWIEKQKIFEEKTKEYGMTETVSLDKDDIKGAIVMTYSGSLVNLGPVIDEKRGCEYTSIGIRKDVPDSVMNEDTILASDMELDEVATFKQGPVESTSQIFKIAVVEEECSQEEERETINNVSTIIADEFVDINKTIIQSN